MARLLGLLAAASLAAAPASGSKVVVLPAVGIGAPLPGPSVVMKATELVSGSLRRAGFEPPGPKVDPAAQRVDLARGQYFDLKFQPALESAEAALAHYAAHPEDVSDVARLVAAHAYAAMALHQLGKRAEGNAHFEAALTLRPDLKLSDAEYPPTALAAVESLRQPLAARPRGALTVSTAPAFAHLELDGKAVGETPATVEGLTAGAHLVRVSKDGYRTASAWVRVTPAGADLAVTLVERPLERLGDQLHEAMAEGAGTQVVDLAAKLAVEAEADAVVLLAVAPDGDRYVVSAALVDSNRHATRAFTTMAQDLFDAAPALGRLAQALVASTPDGAVPRALPTAPTKPLDFAKHYLGLAPPPPVPAAALPSVPPAPVVVAPAPTPLWKRPWIWVVAGGAVAAGTGTYLLTRPPERKPGLAVTVELPQ